MNRTILTLLSIIVLILGCDRGSSLVDTSASDKTLASEIPGGWGTSTYRVYFAGDGTFMDSVFVQSASDPSGFALTQARQGKYTIVNAVLDYTQLHWAYLDTTHYPGGVTILTIPQEIRVDGNQMLLRTVEVLSPVQGVQTQLWGTWKMTHCEYNWIQGHPAYTYEGRQEYTYSFFKDSALCRISWHYLDMPSAPVTDITSEFSYNPPKLMVTAPGWYTMSVEFKFGKMFCYYSDSWSPMQRIRP